MVGFLWSPNCIINRSCYNYVPCIYSRHNGIKSFQKEYSAVQSWFSDIKFSDNLWLSDYFSKTIFQFTKDIKSTYLVTLCDLLTIFVETKSVTKSRVHCISIPGFGETLENKFQSRICHATTRLEQIGWFSIGRFKHN